MESALGEVGGQLRESGGDEDAVVDADAVGGVGVACRDDDALVVTELLVGGHFFHDDEGVVADAGDAAFEMEDGGHATDIDDGRGIAVGCEEGGELARAFRIRAVGDADEEVTASLADVAAVESAGRFDLMRLGVEGGDGATDGFDFTSAGVRSWTGENGQVFSEDSGVFDEGGVGVVEVGGQRGEGEAALFERFAVRCVLLEHGGEVGRAERDGGESVGEVGAGCADDCMVESVFQGA